MSSDSNNIDEEIPNNIDPTFSNTVPNTDFPTPHKNEALLNQNSKHTVLFTNLPRNLDVKDLLTVCKTWGGTHAFEDQIEETGTATVTFFDIRDATRVIGAFNNTKCFGAEYPLIVEASNPFSPPENDISTLALYFKFTDLSDDEVPDFRVPEVRQKLQEALEHFGEVRQVRNGRKNQAFVEYFDTRHTTSAQEIIGNSYEFTQYGENVIIEAQYARLRKPKRKPFNRNYERRPFYSRGFYSDYHPQQGFYPDYGYPNAPPYGYPHPGYYYGPPDQQHYMMPPPHHVPYEGGYYVQQPQEEYQQFYP
eukprot:TRINITY_DN3228_c1_g7_i1.p1 TRINITY_DN3228_c1_g7~~TRINITY_DN3228_c1_g7_i1.p1  ORF type:complete len:307 (-),score=84.27 TRINITY_DN3228_c1_g7_i1:793-1713(-)